MSEFRRRLMMRGKQNAFEVVDHVITNGKVYIDTEYFVNPDTEVELDCMMTKTKAGIEGVRLWGCAEDKFAYQINHSGTNWTTSVFVWTNYIFETGLAPLVNSPMFKANARFVIGLRYHGDTYRCFVDNEYVNSPAPTHTFVNTQLFLLWRKSTSEYVGDGVIYNSCELYIYGFKIFERGTLVKQFVPAVKDGIYGLGELIENKFYASPNGESFNY